MNEQWVGFVVTDRVGCPCAWVGYEASYGWSVYAFGLFRRCFPGPGMDETPYTAMNHGVAFGGKLPDDPWALPYATAQVRWHEEE